MCKWSKHGDTRIDPCMRRLIKYLNMFFDKPVACCCGHGKYPMTIVVKLKYFGTIELLSGAKIPRKTRFYKRDKSGVYYIPEASK
jgi:hypothetical protein